MKINYWDCAYHNYDEAWDGEHETRIYGCSHPDNEHSYCWLENKWGDEKDDCKLLDKSEET